MEPSCKFDNEEKKLSGSNSPSTVCGKNYKIAHLSDLHCIIYKKIRWIEKFEALIDLLKHKKPEVIVITGDSVNHPTFFHYWTYNNSLKKLKRALPDSFIITVPGNHDFSFWGNSLVYSRILQLPYWFFHKKLQNPSKKYEELVVEIFNNTNIAFFPIDSNNVRLFLGLARGYVKSPLPNLNKYNELFESAAKKKNIDYSSCKRVLLMHHHPLPLPNTSDSEENIEKFLVLSNSYQLLEAAFQKKINLILHGHKHVSGVASYKLIGRDGETIVVSSCNSSAKQNHNDNEIKFYDFKARGGIKQTSYKLVGGHANFEHDLKGNNEIVYYGDVRKMAHCSGRVILNSSTCPIVTVNNKTKIVRITDEGDAKVDISASGITWATDIQPNETLITESFHADKGRIKGGLYEFGRWPLAHTIIENQFQWTNSRSSVNPTEIDIFQKEFSPMDKASGTLPDCFKLAYPHLNAFALSDVQHEEMYEDWPDIPRQEICSVSAEYPTYMLELIVRFPPENFPLASSIYLDVTSKKIDEANLNLLYGKNEQDLEEKRFLDKKGALRIRREINEIALMVKYPRPDLLYSLRWNVPVDNQSFDLNKKPVYIRAFKGICKELLDLESQRVTDFYHSVMKEVFFLDEAVDKEKKLFLLGYDAVKNNLEVVRFPACHSLEDMQKVFVGRGPVGRAFRTRSSYFMETSGRLYDSVGRPFYDTEKIVANLSPNSVLTIPILFPNIIPKVLNAECGNLFIPRCCGVFSLVSEAPSGFKALSNFSDEEREDFVSEIYKKISVLFVHHFEEILPF